MIFRYIDTNDWHYTPTHTHADNTIQCIWQTKFYNNKIKNKRAKGTQKIEKVYSKLILKQNNGNKSTKKNIGLTGTSWNTVSIYDNHWPVQVSLGSQYCLDKYGQVKNYCGKKMIGPKKIYISVRLLQILFFLLIQQEWRRKTSRKTNAEHI